MSRSYKRFPVVHYESFDKRMGNRLVRRTTMKLHGGEYKKVYKEFNCKGMWRKEDAIRNYVPSKRFPTLESWLQYYDKCCVRK